MSGAAPLLNVPFDERSWDMWSFQLQNNVNEITAALRTQNRATLPQYQISPIPYDALDQWLERVSTVLGQITGVLNLQSADVENVDLTDDAARQAWTFQVFTEVEAARRALRI